MRNVKIWIAFVMFVIYMFVCFLIPTLIHGKYYQEDNQKVTDNSQEKEQTIRSNLEHIRLLLTETNQVIEIDFNDYIKGVLIGEMPVTYELEALKAQAVVARTYTLYQLKNANVKHAMGADMCDNINCCQAYKTKEYAFASWDDEEENTKWEKIETAVNATNDEVIHYQGELIHAFFHADSGGMTENVKYLWSKVEIPYLVSVPGNEATVYQEEKVFSRAELKEQLKKEIPNIENDMVFAIKDYTGSGRVYMVTINGIEMEATKLRSLLGIKSTNFRMEQDENHITFYTVGYGHGVGMSQNGANQMAIDGSSYQDIIKHYYTGVTIDKIVI